MTLRIAGMGWVTPLGSGVSAVWERLMRGDQAVAERIGSPLHDRTYPVFLVPADATAKAPAHPRLRRSSAISRFAVVAGLAALEDAGVQLRPKEADRTAVIFAISNGGVVYTRRFYHEVVESGAQAASPLLFPETVFNAPASHLAAILGITGASYTLVGDGAVGLLALKMAEDLLLGPDLDRCLVVGAEEADWLLCDAYCRWQLHRREPPIELFRSHPRGTILSEGAGAVLLVPQDVSSEGSPSVCFEQIDAGCNFPSQNQAVKSVQQVLHHLRADQDDVIVASANGTFIDAAEADAVLQQCPGANLYAPKAAMGESVGASGIWQTICAAQALLTQQLPPTPGSAVKPPLFGGGTDEAPLMTRAIVSACGMNQQVAGLCLRRCADWPGVS